MEFTLITGSTSGIGFELARVFAKNNHNLILHGRNEKKLNPVMSQLKKDFPGIKIKSMAIDLLEENASDKIYEYTSKNKLSVDVLVNNAGFGDFGEFHKSDLQKQKDMLKVNVEVLTELTHLFSKDMVERKRGKVLNLASVAAFFPGPFMSAYYASKAYVLHFSQGIAEELKPYGVTVTTLCPGPTESNFQKSASMKFSKLVSQGGIPSSREVAIYGYDELMKGSIVSIYKFKNKLFVFLSRFFPRNWVTKSVMIMQLDKNKKNS